MLCAALCVGALSLLAVAMWQMSHGDWAKAAMAFLCVVGLAAPAIWFATERVDVVLDARAGEMRLTTRRLSGTQHQRHPLQNVLHAMVQTHIGPSDSPKTHRVALVLGPGKAENRLPLTTGYASGRGATDLVARINGWLEAARSGRSA